MSSVLKVFESHETHGLHDEYLHHFVYVVLQKLLQLDLKKNKYIVQIFFIFSLCCCLEFVQDLNFRFGIQINVQLCTEAD